MFKNKLSTRYMIATTHIFRPNHHSIGDVVNIVPPTLTFPGTQFRLSWSGSQWINAISILIEIDHTLDPWLDPWLVWDGEPWPWQWMAAYRHGSELQLVGMAHANDDIYWDRRSIYGCAGGPWCWILITVTVKRKLLFQHILFNMR